MRRVAAVDCGTNTIRLLVADIDVDTGRQDDLARELRIVRLGQDVDRTGRFADEALERVFDAVEQYAGIVEAHHVDAVRFVATSAARDARNGEAFLDGVAARLGVRPEVITGDEEARLSFDGATRTLPAAAEPVAVVDIGGGSTELVLGGTGRVDAARSLDIGSVRLTERLMASDPPTSTELAAATRAVDEALATLPSYGVQVAEAPTLVGVAGTVTTVGMLLLGLDRWDHERVHQSSFPAAAVHDLVARLLAMTVADRQALGVPAGRADVIGAGGLILDRVLRASGAERLVVSAADILDGIAWSVVGSPEA
jgi:exopolyphosphatase/guanosine-5'-triphosphate,3'-diphosphate pyrophosphatase